MKLLHFSDGVIHYEDFLNAIAAKVVSAIKSDYHDPDFVSQSKAYKMFGRRNVERWRRLGKITFYKRPGRVEYKTSDLRYLQRTQQDYFDVQQQSNL